MDDRLRAHVEHAALPDDAFVARVYRFVLRREPDAGARARALRMLGDGTLSRATLLHELVTSDEFARLRAFDDGVAHARWARARGERPRELRPAPVGDSRVVELPWVLARCRNERRVLDVGYAFAEPAYLVALRDLAEDVVGVDLAEADVPWLTRVRADVCALPFDARSFELVLCVSTLEHVGADNTRYGGAADGDSSQMHDALVELRRVLVPDGRLLLTVPAGERRDHGWYTELDVDGWVSVFRAAGFDVHEVETYVATPEGWRSGAPAANGLLCAELHPRRFANMTRRRLRTAYRRLR